MDIEAAIRLFVKYKKETSHCWRCYAQSCFIICWFGIYNYDIETGGTER